MSRLSMKDGRIVLDDQSEKPKSTTQKTSANDSRLSMVDGRIVLADRAPVNTAKNQSYLQRTQKAQQEYLEMDDYTPQRRSSNVMEMAINSLRNRLANSTAGNATREWASRMSNTYQTIANETPVERARRQQARVDRAALIDQVSPAEEARNEARRQQWAIDNAQLIDQASSMYEGPTRTERVRGRNYDTTGADMFSNDWEPGAMQEYDYLRTVRNERYNPLSREDRDDLINRYADAVNGNVDANTYQQILYDVTKHGGIEQLYDEQQADANSDWRYGGALRGNDVSDMSAAERFLSSWGNFAMGIDDSISAAVAGTLAAGEYTGALAGQTYWVNQGKKDAEELFRLYESPDKSESMQEYIKQKEASLREAALKLGGEKYADEVMNYMTNVANGVTPGTVSATFDNDDVSLQIGDVKGEKNYFLNQSNVNAFEQVAENLSNKASTERQRAKDVALLNEISPDIANMAVDAGSTAVESLVDAGIATALGLSGSGLAYIPFALRSFGGSYNEALSAMKNAGQEIGIDARSKAALYGTASAGIEVATEAMWTLGNFMGQVTNGSPLDDVATKKLTEALKGLPKTETGKKALVKIGEYLMGGATEGVEEWVGYTMNYLFNTAGIYSGEGRGEYDWKEVWDSFSAAALSTFISGGAQAAARPAQQAALGRELKAGGITLSDGTKLTVDDMVNLANTPGMEGTTLERSYSSLFKGMPRSTEFTDRELGQLYEAYEETMGRSEEGAERVQEILGKVENGEELKRSDVNRITNNPDAVRYLRSASGTELNLDGNITERKAAVEEALRAFASQNETLRNAMTENLSPNAENANTGDLASRIENLPMINRQAMPAEIARSYFDASVGQTVNDAAGRMGIGEEGRKIMSGLYSGNRENAIDYVGEMTKYYNQGKENKAFNVADTESNQFSNAQQAQAAWMAGRADQLASTAREEISNDREEGLRVRTGSEWQNGQSASGSAGIVEEGTAAAQRGQAGPVQREGGNARVSSESLRQNASYAIASTGLRVVTNDSRLANAKKYAEDHGMNFVAWAGGALTIDGEQSRGYYDPETNTVYVRADHQLFTAEQLTIHETTHGRIRNGEIVLGRVDGKEETASLKTVYKTLVKELGGLEKFEEVLDAYVEIYAGINISRQGVFEEMICDAMAGMNDFLSVGHFEEALKHAAALETAGRVARENAENGENMPQTEGGGKYSGATEVLALKNVDWMPNNSSIKAQLIKHRAEIDSMEPVAVVSLYAGEDGLALEKLILAQREKIGGGRISRNGIVFEFDDEGAHKIVSHARQAWNKAAALAAPYVAKHGKLIAGQKDHEDSGLPTLTYAAPAYIAGIRVNVGVVIQFETNGRPKAVNVEADSANAMRELKKATSGSRQRNLKSQVAPYTTGSFSRNSLSDETASVKREIDAYLPKTAVEVSSRYDGTNSAYGIDQNGRKFSLDSLGKDIVDRKFQSDLVNRLGWTTARVDQLVASLNDLMEYIKPNRDILDLNEEYTKETRPYSPYKPNSDPLYKISLDYSTLCRKRLMTQYIIEKLQLREHRPMSGEEQIAIRDMLKEYRQIESGLQVACAMCYVEAARLKSPDQMNRYFEDPEPVLKNFFAQKNKAYKRNVENLQKKWKTDHGYEAAATKKEMTPADVAAFNEYSSKIRHDYNPATDQADAKRRKEELAAIERAKNLSPDNYLSAENLANLKEQDPLVYDAYTSNIRAATRSKGLETDVPYYYGDSRRKGGPSDKFIKNVNAENGMRFSSWSDFQFTHLLDQMMATIDLSVRKAAMHGYTKFPEQVRIFGRTGAMFNMSGVSGGTGFNADGSLYFSPTESIDFEEAKRLRDQFPDTAGLQCIGINDKHVKALLASDYIDYVIPYHVSGMNAALRNMAKISSWKDYTSTQEESVIDSKAKWEDSDRRCPKDKWHKGPVFSEFFDPAWYTDPAYKGKGVEAMREAAKRYVQMCADRGMRPKFTQFLNEANYWKLLIDRKMVNQKTGDLIQQRPVTPDFDFDVIKKEIADYVAKTRKEQGIEDRALEYISDHWDELPGRIAALKAEGTVEKNIARAEEIERIEHQANVLGSEMYAAAPRNVAAYKYSRDIDTVYMSAAESGDTATAQKLVDEAAEEAMPDSKIRNKNGKLLKVYHGTDADFNVFDTTVSGGKNGRAEGFGIYLSPDQELTKSYGDRQIGMFANITKPAYSNRKTISVTKLKALLKSTCEAEAKEMAEDYGGSVKDALKDTWISNYVDTYSNSMEIAYTKAAQDILRMNGSDMEVIQEVMVGMAIREYADAIAFYNDHLTPVTGFDGFWTEWTNRETGKKTPVILAFNSNQLKVADAITRNDDGNIIPLEERFNPKNDDIRFSRDLGGGYVSYNDRALISNETVDYWLDAYAASNPNYAQAYVTYMKPSDFLALTTTSTESRSRIREQSEGLTPEKTVEYSRRQPIQLMINSETGEVEGHEGRHRMVALENAGIKQVPVLLFDSRNKYSKRAMESMFLTGQTFDEDCPNNARVVVDDVQPLSRGNADVVREKFSTQTAKERAYERIGDRQVRFSRDLSNTELYEANRQLQKDLTELRSKLKTRTEQYKYWKGQTKVTEGRQLRTDDVTKLAREIIKGQESSADAKAVAEKMKALGEYMLNSQDENVYDEARLKAYEIAHEILSNAKVLNEQGGEHFYKDFRDALMQTPIYVTPSVREEVSPDGWSGLRQMAKGIFTPTADKSKGKPVDVIYHDLQSTFGEWLLPEYITSEADQLNKIFEVVETYQPVYENANSYDMADATEWTANEILTRIIGEEIRETNPTYADRMEKKLSDQKVKSQEALRRVREQRDRKVQNLKEHYQQVAEDRRNRKIDSEMRTRLLHIAKRLNNKKLTRATRSLLDQYIGELDLVSKGILGRTVKELESLQAWYDSYKESMGDDFIPDKFIERKIARLSKRHISDLTQEEVADLTTVLLNIETMIRTQNELIESKIKMDAYAAGVQTIDDINNSNGKTGFLNKFISTETATPEREIHRITGYRENSPLYQAAKELSDGQRKMLDYQMRAEALFKKWTTDKKFIQSIAGKKAEAIIVKGYVDGAMQDVVITPAMRMALYLHSKNDDNMRHIAKGGVKIPNMSLYVKGKIQEAYDKADRVVFTRGMINEIAAHMSDKERAFADAVDRYYNGMSRNEINDTSEALRGYAIAGVDHYYPIDTDGSFLKKEFDAIKRDGSIEGMGILKERIEGATNPIMLYDMNDTLNRSISQHSKYVGLAIPVRNFNKLYSVTTFNYETSVAETLKKNWGSDATKYVEKMMADLQNGTGLASDSWGDLLAKARSHYAGAVLTTNLSVAMKQAASYPTAAAVVGYGPLIKAFADVGKVDLDTLDKYTPLLWYRRKGFSTPELGDIGKEGRQIPKALNWIQGMDVATTTKLVKAAMIYVNENQQGLARNTDAWWKAVAEVYNRIIEETQPNYTMMQRPQILRSDNALTRAIMMFKTQPFQNFNILYDAFGNLSAKSREYKANTTQENLRALKSARTNAVRAVASQAVSAFVFALMQFAWDVFRGKAGKYKDKDDEMTFASWLKGMGINVLSSVGGMIPFGSYVLELGEAMTDAILKGFKKNPVFDQTFYGLSENAAKSMNDMGNALLSIINKTTKALQGEATTETTVRGLVDGAADIAQFAGMPVSNVIKLAQSIARNVFLATDGQYLGEYKALRVTTDPAKYSSDYYDLLYKAYNKDKAAYEELVQTMIEDGFTEDKIKNAMETRMKKSQGVNSVSDLESRWMSPNQQSTYDQRLSGLEQTTMFQAATDEQQQALLNKLYNLAVGNSDGKKLDEKIKGGASVGLDQTEYLLFQLALSMSDADGSGKANQEEAEAAALMVPGLSPEERAYLFQSVDSKWKNNPFK